MSHKSKIETSFTRNFTKRVETFTQNYYSNEDYVFVPWPWSFCPRPVTILYPSYPHFSNVVPLKGFLKGPRPFYDLTVLFDSIAFHYIFKYLKLKQFRPFNDGFRPLMTLKNAWGRKRDGIWKNRYGTVTEQNRFLYCINYGEFLRDILSQDFFKFHIQFEDIFG